MKNIYLPEKEIEKDNLLFVCFLIEKIARKQRLHNKEVVNILRTENLEHLLSVSDVLCCEPIEYTIEQWINYCKIPQGTFDRTDLKLPFEKKIPTPLNVAHIYQELIWNTCGEKDKNETLSQSIIKIYNHWICEHIDDYRCSWHHEPNFIILDLYNSKI